MAFVEMLKNAFDWDDGADDEILEDYQEEVVETESIFDKIRAKRNSKKLDNDLNSDIQEASVRSSRTSRKESRSNFERSNYDKREKVSQRTRTSKNYEQPDLKVVNINNKSNLGIVANIKLSRFEEVKKVTSHLKLNRVVICDFNNLEPAEGQRALDFVCGACAAIDADIQRAGTVGSLYIVTPAGVNTVGDENDEFRYKGVFPWIKN